MQITKKFTFERETKGAVRFQEEVPEDGEAAIGTLYLRKSALGGERPTEVTVTVSTEDADSDA